MYIIFVAALKKALFVLLVSALRKALKERTLMRLMAHLAGGGGPLAKVAGLTSNAIAGTASVYDYELRDVIGARADLSVVIPVATSVAASFAVTAVSSTQVTVVCDTASVDFDLYIG